MSASALFGPVLWQLAWNGHLDCAKVQDWLWQKCPCKDMATRASSGTINKTSDRVVARIG